MGTRRYFNIDRERLKCFYESSRPPEWMDNYGLPPVVPLFKRKQKHRQGEGGVGILNLLSVVDMF